MTCRLFATSPRVISSIGDAPQTSSRGDARAADAREARGTRRPRDVSTMSTRDGGGDGAKKTSYLDDLLSGSVNFMDARAARGARSMRTMGASASGGARSTAVATPSAPRAPSAEMKAPETTTTGGDDLEAFFGAPRVDARAKGGLGASNASSSSFGDLDAFASAPASERRGGGGRDDDEDDFLRGLGLGARATAGGGARATGGGDGCGDVFDLLSATSSVSGSRPASPVGNGATRPPPTRLQTTPADDDESLIDGLDEILGEVSIASTPRKSASVEKMASTSSLSSLSKSASRLEAEDVAEASPESPVGLARFRSNASAESRESTPVMTPTPSRIKVEVRPKSKPPTEEPARTTKPPPAPTPEPKPTTTTSSARSSVDDLDDFFSAGGATTPRQTPAKSAVDSIEAMFTVNQPNAPPTPADGVVDDLFGAMDVQGMTATAKASVSFEYNPEEEVDPNEPPERAALRKARHERNRQRIEAALAEKRARETAARQEQSERQMLKDLIGADIDAWQKKNQNNIRTMLANLADVLWEGHRYKSPDMGALMQPVGVKKCYHRALVVIHPDKVSQAGGDMSQRYIADKVFDIVKVAYKEFEAKELK